MASSNFVEQLKQARSQGYSSTEILNEFVKQNPGMKDEVNSARGVAGDDDILNEVISQNTVTEQAAPPQNESSVFGNFIRGVAKETGVLDTLATGVRAAQGVYRLAKGDGTASDRDLDKPVSFGPLGTGEAMKIGVDIGTGSSPFSWNTTGRTIGRGVSLGSTLAGTGATVSAAKTAATSGLKSVVKRGAVEGLLSGAVGGAGSGLSQKDSTASGILQSTVSGAAFGAGAGAALAPVVALTSKTGRAALAANKAQQNQEKIVELITPKVDKKTITAALKRGEISVEDATMLSGARIKPTSTDIRIAENVSGVVNPKNTPIKNITSINKKIAEISENEVAPFLERFGAKYEVPALRERLVSIKNNAPLSYKTDPQLERVYNGVIDEALKAAQKKDKTTLGLWEARKAFDEAIKREFGDSALSKEARSVRDIAIREARSVMNDFIAESTPNEVFKSQMTRLSDLFTARDRIVERTVKDFDKSRLQTKVNKKPLLKEVLKYGAIAAGGGAGGIFGSNLLGRD